MESKAAEPVLATNRKARHDYHILESWEAGLSLTGGEVKSCRAGGASLAEAFASFDGKGNLLVQGMRIQPWGAAGRIAFTPHDPVRGRQVLMHRRELDRLLGRVQAKGLTVVPLKLYVRRGRIKVELGLGQGKLQADKRESLKRKSAEREMSRAAGRR
jgi:SsrA-binding protein